MLASFTAMPCWASIIGADSRMTENKRTVEAYMEGFRQSDHATVLSCLTDDVEWEIPGAFRLRGKKDFEQHIVGEGFLPNPMITVVRLTEESDVVVAEGSVRTERTDGTVINLKFCDVFEMLGGRIRRLTSYLAMT